MHIALYSPNCIEKVLFYIILNTLCKTGQKQCPRHCYVTRSSDGRVASSSSNASKSPQSSFSRLCSSRNTRSLSVSRRFVVLLLVTFRIHICSAACLSILVNLINIVFEYQYLAAAGRRAVGAGAGAGGAQLVDSRPRDHRRADAAVLPQGDRSCRQWQRSDTCGRATRVLFAHCTRHRRHCGARRAVRPVRAAGLLLARVAREAHTPLRRTPARCMPFQSVDAI